MSKILTVVLTTFLLALSVAAQTEQIVWEKDFKKAQALARETGRPLLLDFTASWCKPCQAMEKEFWILEDVVKAMKPFVAVKIDFDKERSLAGKYGVSSIPFVAFTDPLGDIVTYRNGFGTKSAKEINLIFSEMPKDFSAIIKEYDAIEAKKNDGAALLKIADFYSKSQMLFLSNNYYKRAAKTPEISGDAETKERVAARIGINYYQSRSYKEAIDFAGDYLKDYPTGKYRDVSTAVLVIANANLGKIKESEKQLQILKTEFPASKNLPDAVQAIEEAKSKKKN